MEFKPSLTTHDVLTYSTKARKHKQVYPYLRYGLVLGNDPSVPGRFFTHNEALDFCVAAATYKGPRLHELFATLLDKEVKASQVLEKLIFGNEKVITYREDFILETDGNKVV
jgi:hypothetical protein